MVHLSALSVLLALAVVGGSVEGRKYKMVCYYSSWATYRNGYGTFTSRDIDPFLCTHVVYAFAGLDTNYRIRVLDPWLSLTAAEGGGKADFQLFTSLRGRNPDLKLMIGVGGWNEGSPRYSQMASSPANRKIFIDSVLNFIQRYDFDGLNLDWQYPANRGGIPLDKSSFVLLLKELQEALSKNNYALGISAAGNLEILNMGYDVPQVTKYVDYVSLLTYDYQGAWNAYTGMNSPLYPHKGASLRDKDLTQDATVQYWITKGADKSKLLLGLSTYGRTYVLADRSRNGLGDRAFRPGNPGRYTQQDGFLGYNEIVEMMTERDGWVVKHDEDTKVPYAINDDLWISYDNEWSFGIKAEYAKSHGLGGLMVWSLDTDDFHGIGGQRNPLLQAALDVLESDSPVRPPVTPSVTPTAGPDRSTKAPSRIECKGPGTFRDPVDCTRYYTCISSPSGYVPVLNSCPPPLVFDDNSKACNWREAVPGC